jgi:hypothetical protein
MFSGAIRNRDLRALLQSTYLLAPPFSFNLLAAGLAVILAWVTAFLGGPIWPSWLAIAIFLLHGTYFMLGASEIGFSTMTVVALSMIPLFAVWRVLIYTHAYLLNRMPSHWTRTPRI